MRRPTNEDRDFALPTAAELAAEDAALHESVDAEPLSSEEVAALMARFHAATGVSARKRSRRRLLPLLAAMVAVLLVPAAWVGAKVVWPSGRNAPFELTYHDAILAATDPARPDAQHVAAIARIDDHCSHAIGELRRLPKEDAIAARAARMLAELAPIVAPTAPLPAAPPEELDREFLPCLSTVTDPSRSMTERETALEQLERLMHAGLVAIAVSRHEAVKTPESRDKATRWIDRLHRDLTGGAPPQPAATSDS